MTEGAQSTTRLWQAWDRLAWGMSDLRRLLVERGLWPAPVEIVAAADGVRWRVVGTRLLPLKADRRPTGALVAEADCLWGGLQLPPMARSDLGRAMDEALWRLSPLPPDQAWLAWRAEPAPEGGWSVEWGLCRRDAGAGLVAAHALSGSAPIFLERAGRVLPAGGALPPARRRLVDALAVLGTLMIVAALLVPATLPLALKRQAVVRAVQHVSALEPQAAPLRQQLDALRSDASVMDALDKDIRSAVPLAAVVEQLAAQLPDGTWLDRLDVNGREIRIMGLTGNAGDLMAHLSRVPAFTDVRASGASVRDNTLDKERFTFDLRWRGEEGGT